MLPGNTPGNTPGAPFAKKAPMSRPDTSPSEAAKKLNALKTIDRTKWRKVLERAFAGDEIVTINDAGERLPSILGLPKGSDSVSRDCLLRHVTELEEETGERLNRPGSGRKDGT